MESTHNLQNHHAEDTLMGEGKKLPYPKTVFFIVVTEFCERFAYYGMRAVLTVYMRNVLNFSDDLATSIYHVFLFLCYFLPLFGAVLADSFMGKYRTVLLLSSIFAVGNFLLTAASLPPLNLPVTAISLTGLFLMAVGTGGIKPCVAPLGGDQFILPQQERQLRQFFSVFTFAVSVGNMCSTLLTPVLRNEVTCFNQDCYPLAFGVPAGLMIFAVGIFMIGKPFYIVNKPKDNIILRVFQCMIYAASQRKQKSKEIEERSSSPQKHWVDYAYHKGSKFDKQLVEDTKGLLRVLVYYLPVPMFWALYEQLGSRWTIQATRMDGNLGSFSIQPDQMQVANAILMFTFIPIFETVLYPLLRKCNVFRRPLQRMVVGGLLASLSFLLAGLVEMRIEGTDLRLPAVNQTHLMVVNTLACPVHCDIKRLNSTEGHQSYFEVEAQFNTILRSIKERNLELRCRTAAMTVGDNGGQCSQTPTEFFSTASNKTALTWSGSIRTLPGKLQAVIITRDCEGMTLKVHNLNRSEDTIKSKEGHAKLSIVGLDTCGAGANSTSLSVTVTGDRDEYLSLTNITHYLAPPIDLSLRPGRYSIKSQYDSLNPMLAENATEIVDLRTGGNYMVIFMRNANDLLVKVQLVTIIEPNKIHMLWLLPQYILIAWGEILFMISGMEFSFTEAPVSMKSVLQACWHLSNACGNLMVIIAAQSKGKNSQATEFFIFASLMFVDSIIFGFMASRYKYVKLGDVNNGDDESEGGTERKQATSAPILSNGNEETRF